MYNISYIIKFDLPTAASEVLVSSRTSHRYYKYITTILNALEFCLFGRKLSKLYSEVKVADVIHVKSDTYETVKFLLVDMVPFILVDLVPPFKSKDGYDIFLTKHCFPFIILLNGINQKIRCGSSEKIFVCLNPEKSFHTFTGMGEQQGMNKAAIQT